MKVYLDDEKTHEDQCPQNGIQCGLDSNDRDHCGTLLCGLWKSFCNNNFCSFQLETKKIGRIPKCDLDRIKKY